MYNEHGGVVGGAPTKDGAIAKAKKWDPSRGEFKKAYSYDRSKTAASTKLDNKVKREANAALRRGGLDGNGRYRKIGEGLAKAFNILSQFGIESDEVLNAHKFPEAGGTAQVEIALSNKEDPFSPMNISNSVLFISWTELQQGRVEVVAYLS